VFFSEHRVYGRVAKLFEHPSYHVRKNSLEYFGLNFMKY